MAHRQQHDFVRLVSIGLPRYFHDAKVLEVGSLNIGGSVRDLFRNCNYIGIDVGPGRDVDIVCQGQDYNAPDETFDHIISCEAMEHNPYWKETFNNMMRVCRTGGLVTMTCATTGRPEHGTSRTTSDASPLTIEQGWEYYRNLTGRDLLSEFNLSSVFSHYRLWVNWESYDLYFLGLKKSPVVSDNISTAWETTLKSVDQYITLANDPMICRFRALVARLGGERWFDRIRSVRR